MRRTRIAAPMMALGLMCLGRAAMAQASALGVDAIVADIGALVDTLRAHHPKLRLIDERARFDSAAREVLERARHASATEAILEMARLVALLDDGHSGIALGGEAGVGFHRYPIDVGDFADGIFVTRANATAARLLGGRLVRIGGVEAPDLVRRLRPWLVGDNEMSKRSGLPARLVLHELLVAIGAADARGATFVVADRGGRLDSLALPIPDAAPPRLTTTARDTATPEPLYLRNRTRAYWFTTLVNERLVYAQVNSLTRDPRSSFTAFSDSVIAAFESMPAEKLVIDLRLNGGGDGTMANTLVHRIIRSPRLAERGRLYVIIGRATFSAAVILTAALEEHTAAIFVGEPTGAPANHYGEPMRFRLPRTGIGVSYSQLFWQNGDPRDARPWIPPSLPASPTFAAWRANRDPALDVILAPRGGAVGPGGIARPPVSVGGAYATRVAVLVDSCGDAAAAPMPTVVQHVAGDSALRVTHAGNGFPGRVTTTGDFTTDPTDLNLGGAVYRMQIAGQFSSGGFRAMVTVDVNDPRRAGRCRFVVGWLGTKTGAPNVIPDP